MKLQAAHEMVAELEGLNDNEKAELTQSLDELIKNSPKAEVASFRFKRIMKKVGKESYEMVKGVLTDVLSEAAKKMLFGA